mmetsp:Transcript_54915/g.163395  ORF Transcript_54915/g.163395 Transcript_54915/m.163395 type:complete len:380 (-) Transcript_54915:935-2074(-)
MVLDAIVDRHRLVQEHNCVSVNHFDVDAFFSVWSLANPVAAMRNARLLRLCARLGDFREIGKIGEGSEDGAMGQCAVSLDDDDKLALRVVAWMNVVERELFCRPFESGGAEEDDDAKMVFFLSMFSSLWLDDSDATCASGGALRASSHATAERWLARVAAEYPSLDASRLDGLPWEAEYDRIVQQFDSFAAGRSTSITRYPELEFCVIVRDEPVHYYPLFSHSQGCDVLLACYGGQRFELEQKYTTYINLKSRPVRPRLDLQPLRGALNAIEAARGNAQYAWSASRFTDSGPILRLDPVDGARALTKAERYGNPDERPIFSSSLSAEELRDICVSYLTFGYESGGDRQADNFTWADYREYNRNIDWGRWVPPHGAPTVV